MSTSSPSSSLVCVSATKVRAAGEALIASITAMQQRKRENEIASYLKDEPPHVKWTLRGRVKTHRTRVEAETVIDKVRHWDCGHDYGWWRFTGSDWSELGKRLITAANLSSDGHVWLSLEDAATVEEYLPKEQS